MGYVQDVLGKDEFVQHKASISLAAYILNFVFGGLLLLGSLPAMFAGREISGFMAPIAIFALFLIVWPLIVRSTTELVLTNRRVIAKFGIISRDTVEINYKKIESIRVSQSLVGRMFNYGSVIVTGSGATHAPIKNIADPINFRRAFDVAHEEFESSSQKLPA